MKKVCPGCGAIEGKGRWCPACQSVRSEQPRVVQAETRRVKPTRTVVPGGSAVTSRYTPTEDDQITERVPCACGCGRLVKTRPVYAGTACRARAWRKRQAVELGRPEISVVYMDEVENMPVGLLEKVPPAGSVLMPAPLDTHGIPPGVRETALPGQPCSERTRPSPKLSVSPPFEAGARKVRLPERVLSRLPLDHEDVNFGDTAPPTVVTTAATSVSPPSSPRTAGLSCTCGPGEKARGNHNKWCPMREK